MAAVVNENSVQSSVITQQGRTFKLKGCYYCFLKRRKNGGVEHDKVPETPFASMSSAVTELFDFDNDNMMKHHLQLAA